VNCELIEATESDRSPAGRHCTLRASGVGRSARAEDVGLWKSRVDYRPIADGLPLANVVLPGIDNKDVRQWLTTSRDRSLQPLRHTTFVKSVNDERTSGPEDAIDLFEHFEVVATTVKVAEAVMERHDEAKLSGGEVGPEVLHVAADKPDLLSGFPRRLIGVWRPKLRRIALASAFEPSMMNKRGTIEAALD
jgi:hypothetical protein